MVQQAEVGRFISLSSGVVLRRRSPASVAAVREVIMQEQPLRPKPPERYDEDRGKSLPVMDDPDYLAALTAWQERLGQRVLAVAAVGLAIEELPSDLAGPESAEWAEQLELMGFELEATPLRRWLQWLRLNLSTADAAALVSPLFGIDPALPSVIGTEPDGAAADERDTTAGQPLPQQQATAVALPLAAMEPEPARMGAWTE